LLSNSHKAIIEQSLWLSQICPKYSQAHQNQMMQLLSDPKKASDFARIVFDLLKKSDDVSAG